MEIRNRETGELTTVSQFKALHPQTSFPKQITPEILDMYGYDPVLNGPAAATSGPYEISVRDGVEEVDGQWFTKFIVGPVFADTDEATAAEQQAAYEQGVDERAAEAVRTERTKRLAECDWTQLADAPVDATAWGAYRAELRDITAQEGFPHDVTWPELPA